MKSGAAKEKRNPFRFNALRVEKREAGVATTPSSSRGTGHVLYAVRRRGRTPLATAARLTSFGGYFATTASHRSSTHYPLSIINRKSKNRKSLPATIYPLSTVKRKGFRFSLSVLSVCSVVLPNHKSLLIYPLPTTNYIYQLLNGTRRSSSEQK